jgi:preprotein translocase subunit YajC
LICFSEPFTFPYLAVLQVTNTIKIEKTIIAPFSTFLFHIKKDLKMKKLASLITLPAFAMAQEAPVPTQPSLMSSFLPFLLMFVVMYIFFILPKQRENKKTEQMRTSLKKGDKVLTIAGIVGIVSHIDERFVSVRTGDTKIDFEKASIVKLLEADSEKKHEAEHK